jgi:hypothetical protein
MAVGSTLFPVVHDQLLYLADVCGHVVVGEKGVQEETKDISLRGPHVEGQRGGCDIAYPHHLGSESPGSSCRGRCSDSVLSLVMSLEGTMVLNAEL